MVQDDLKVYLPKYLSDESYQELISGLRDFPDNLDSRVYTVTLKKEKNIFQGDGILGLPIVNIENMAVKDVTAIILSNTCDVDPENKRFFPSSIVFSPIINLSKYILTLENNGVSKEKIESHIRSVKKQHISQILYLPSDGHNLAESLVYLDKIYNVPSTMLDIETLEDRRVFTLSDYGAYLFLFKISTHFTRIQDKVDRGTGILN